MTAIKLINILSALQGLANAVPICANDANTAQPLYKHAGESLTLSCHHHWGVRLQALQPINTPL